MRVERFLAASTVSQLAKGIITEESPLLKKKKACCLPQRLSNRASADPAESHKPPSCTIEQGPHVKSFRKLSLLY